MTLTAPPAAADSVPEPSFSRVDVIVQAGALLASVVDGVRFGHLDDTEAIAVMAALEALGRKVDGARLRATTDIGARAETDLGAGSLAYKNGCRNRVEFISHLAGISAREAKRRLKLGETAVERTPLGLPVPARYPVIADGLISGDLGLESAEIIATTLTALHGQVGQDDLDRVERALVASATGAITPETAGLPGAGIRFAPDLLRAQAVEWQGRLDPDGTAPNDGAVEAKSTLTALIYDVTQNVKPGSENAVEIIKKAIDNAFQGYEQVTQATRQAVQTVEAQIAQATAQVMPAAGKDK